MDGTGCFASRRNAGRRGGGAASSRQWSGRCPAALRPGAASPLIEQARAAVLDADEEATFEAIASNLEGASPKGRIRNEILEEGGLRLAS